MSRKATREMAAALAAVESAVLPTLSAVRDRPPADPAIPYRELPLGRVFESPLNPRRHRNADGLAELARSIAEKGLLQPILVRAAADGRYEIIHGARRHAAARLACEQGLLPADYRIPARIRECTDDELVILAGVENFDREDMDPLDEAELFAAVRLAVAPRDGEAREAAVARLFHIGERTVFRRLALTRLAPELQQGLRDKQLTLGQAQAFALGDPQDQRQLFRRMRDDRNRWLERDPEGIRRAMTRSRIPLDHALFDPALYRGERIVDAEIGREWFADAGEFKRLQEQAVRAKTAELGQRWKWVAIERGHFPYEKYQIHDVKKSDSEAGAVILMGSDGSVEIKMPALKAETVKARQRAQRAKAGLPSVRRAPLTEAQLVALHRAKTRALRHAVSRASSHVTLALAILGLAGVCEVRIGEGDTWGSGLAALTTAHEDAATTAPEDAARLAEMLELFGLRGKPWDIDAAASFGRLVAAPFGRLEELFARLIAERIGSWISDPKSGPGAQLGDSPLACAIAAATDAATVLPNFWRPGEDWFKAYPKPRLEDLARALPEQHDWRGLKKSALVALLLAQSPGTWTPDRFGEAHFQSEEAAARALGAPAQSAPVAPDEAPDPEEDATNEEGEEEAAV